MTALNLKLALLELEQSRLRIACDASKDDDKWITTETGSHILVGKDGTIKAGAGGKFNGKSLSSMGGAKKFTKYETVAERHQSEMKKAYEKQESEKPKVINEDKHGRRLSQSAKGFHATNQFGQMETFETEKQAINFINKADKGANIEPFSTQKPKEKKEKLFSLEDQKRFNEIESTRLKEGFDRNSESGKALLQERKKLSEKAQALKHEQQPQSTQQTTQPENQF